MLRRLKFFAFGALISVIFLSIGPENRMKNTFYAYVDYFNPEKRVVGQMIIADSINHSDNNASEIKEFYEKAWVNHELSDKNSNPQLFVLDNNINEVNKRLTLHFYNNEERKIDGKLKSYTCVDIITFEEVETLSKRSYKSYFSLIGIFLLVMIPVALLVRNLIKKRRLEVE
jgi:hypothetical protein